MKERVLSAYRSHEGEMLTSELLSAYVYNRDDAAEDESFFGRIDKYISRKERLGEHVKADKTLKGALRRFEKYAESFSQGSFSQGSFSAPLFPFVSPQKYNDAIKNIFRLCGIDRLVTVLDPVTGEERKRPICEVASSHMARRTFIGNIYKKVKDPNLVGSMTGHKEGSRAFSRYREIDDEIKKELFSLIE